MLTGADIVLLSLAINMASQKDLFSFVLFVIFSVALLVWRK